MRIGYLPENNPLYTDMAIIDYLRFCAEIQGMQKSQVSERIGEMIDLCGLEVEGTKKSVNYQKDTGSVWVSHRQ